MFYQPQKVTLSPQKVKKVKKNFFFIFHILCEKKSHLYIYFLNFGPLPHLKNPYYENVKFFQKIKFSSNQPKNLEIYSHLVGGLVLCHNCTTYVALVAHSLFVPHLWHISNTVIGQYKSRD